MMFGSNHEGYYHSNQFLLLGTEAGASHGGSTGCLLIRYREASSDPDELIRQLELIAMRLAYPGEIPGIRNEGCKVFATSVHQLYTYAWCVTYSAYRS